VPNNAEAPLDNPLVRQAIAHAIDRQAIAAAVFFGQATPITGGVIPSWSWAHAGIEAVAPTADPDRARALLAEANLAGGFETSLTVASSLPGMAGIAAVVQANLAAIGIRATVRTVEIPRYWDEVWAPSAFDMTAMYWVSPLADPDDFVFNNYACATPINTQQSCSPAMDAMMQAAKSGRSLEERRVWYLAQQRLSVDEMPIIPLVNAWILTAHTDRLQGFVPMRTGFLHSLRDAWLA
jgi:ABC-type transport system substrate-binding protein